MYADYLYISSRDKIVPSDTSSSFKVHLNHPIEGKHWINLSYFSVMNTIYNVTSENNNITVDVGGTPYNAVIPIGSYNITSLTGALKSALDNNGSLLTYAVSYSDTTFLITISAGSSFSLLFGTSKNQINEVIGFEPQDTNAATSVTGSYAIDLHSPILFVRINELGSQYNASNHDDRMTFVVPVQVNSGDMITYTEKSAYDQQKLINNRVISEMKITILDKNNKVVDLHGAEVTMIFSLN